MKSILDELSTDIERAESLQSQLISVATGGSALPYEYQELRRFFVESPLYSNIIPSFVKTNRNIDQFWQFIKYKFGTYAERRQYIWDEFQELMDYLEGKRTSLMY